MRNIIMADRQDITRIGTESLIHNTGKAKSVTEVDNKKDLAQLLTAMPSAIVVLDYSLFDFESESELLTISKQFGDVRWLLFSAELSTLIFRSLVMESDMFSIVYKTSAMEEINTAIAYTLRGERFICAKAANELLLRQRTKIENGNILTSTEKLILRELVIGKTTKEIASSRNSSFHTITTHRKNIFRKLEVTSVHAAVQYAIRTGIVYIDDYAI